MKRVLIVDDSSFARIALSNILSKNGYSVAGSAECGKDAVIKYIELLPDIVTLDITMPDMDGIEALKNIINYDNSAKIVMVSAMGKRRKVIEAVSAGAKGFVVKPFSEEAVVETLQKLFG